MKTTAVEIKGKTLAVLVLQIEETDQDVLYDHLHKSIEKGRTFFDNAPFLIDFEHIGATRQRDVDLPRLVSTLRGLNVVPVAVRGIDEYLKEQALKLGIGILPAQGQMKSFAIIKETESIATGKTTDKTPNPTTQAEAACNNTGDFKTRVVTKPVRSGQRILTPGDLVVLSSVNAGAEVLAGGNIHIYGPLRGRVLAGIDGDSTARIFCMQCNPELVAISGIYMVNESLSREVINQRMVISCEGEGLIFTPL